MSVQLQERDLKILKLAFENRVVTMNQLKRKFFSSTKSSTFCDRISLLCKDKYLTCGSISINNRFNKVLSATEKSFASICDSWPFEIDVPHFKSESQGHDVRLGEVRFVFEKLSSFHSYISENLLQSSTAIAQDPRLGDLAKLQSDAGLMLNGPDKNQYLFGIELEISKKSPDRYKDKLASYYMARDIEGVIYICQDQAIVNCLAQADKDIRTNKESILYFALESDVLKTQNKMFFKSPQGDGIELF